MYWFGSTKGLKNFEIALKGSPPYPVTIKEPGPIEVHSPYVDFRVLNGSVLAICSEKEEIMRMMDVDLLTYPQS